MSKDQHSLSHSPLVTLLRINEREHILVWAVWVSPELQCDYVRLTTHLFSCMDLSRKNKEEVLDTRKTQGFSVQQSTIFTQDQRGDRRGYNTKSLLQLSDPIKK